HGLGEGGARRAQSSRIYQPFAAIHHVRCLYHIRGQRKRYNPADSRTSMATEQNAATAEPSQSFLSDFGGMFNFLMDPGGAAKRLPRKFFWIAPLILVSIVFMACGFFNLPLIQQAMMNQPPPPNANPEQFQKGMQLAVMFQRIGVFLSPLIFLVIAAVSALIILAAAS